MGITNATMGRGTPNFSITSIARGNAASELVVAKAIEAGSATARMNFRTGIFAIHITGNSTPPRKMTRET